MSFSLCQSANNLCVLSLYIFFILIKPQSENDIKYFWLIFFVVGLPEVITVITLFSSKYFEFHSYTCFIWIVSDLLNVCGTMCQTFSSSFCIPL